MIGKKGHRKPIGFWESLRMKNKPETETVSNAKYIERFVDAADVKDSIKALEETTGTSLEDFIGDLK